MVQDPMSTPLPKPNVTYVTNEMTPTTEADLRGLLANPIYAGLGQSPPIVPEEQWVRSNAKLIREIGPEQYLVNLLYLLRETLKSGHPL